MKEENERRNVCGDKVRGFYRPPAATMVVGRRKLLALVANDRLLEISATWLRALAASLNILTNNSQIVIKGDHVSVVYYFFFFFTIISFTHQRIQGIQETVTPLCDSLFDCIISCVYTIIYK